MHPLSETLNSLHGCGTPLWHRFPSCRLSLPQHQEMLSPALFSPLSVTHALFNSQCIDVSAACCARPSASHSLKRCLRMLIRGNQELLGLWMGSSLDRMLCKHQTPSILNSWDDKLRTHSQNGFLRAATLPFIAWKCVYHSPQIAVLASDLWRDPARKLYLMSCMPGAKSQQHARHNEQQGWIMP